MNRIKILDDATINKIAAGEVVERPLNVVKELVENSIDANATGISIEIKGGGIDLIRVTDNGSGIDHDNIPLAFCRHATSKIISADDLMSVSTLGFRGEALASVAAVAKVELMTKTASSILGYRYVIEGGRNMAFDEAGIPSGTTVIVRDLFYNTPARRKFLKSATTEGNYVTELVERLILSHPSISFKYVVNGKLRLSSDGLGDVMSGIYSVFGRDITSSLVSVSSDAEGCSITGFVGKPETARGNRNCELFYVNGRMVKSKVLTSATEEAYKPYLMLHRFPFVILYITVPPNLIDVNVHPAKTEIRFSDEQYIYSCIRDTVTGGITYRELIPEVTNAKSAPVSEDRKPEIISEHTDKTENISVPEPFETKRVEEYRTKAAVMISEAKEARKESTEQLNLFKEGLLAVDSLPNIRIIGQVFDTFWIIEYENKMYIIDQHAAHEKVLYERLSRRIAENSVISQLLSPPFIVSLSVSKEETLIANKEVFEQMGFEVSHFGGREYAISAVPAELFGMSEQEYFLAVIDDLYDNPQIKDPEQKKDRIATMSCKAAVKGNMRMSVPEAEALIRELLTLDNPYNCPHGRPTIISFTRSELDKMFKRIV